MLLRNVAIISFTFSLCSNQISAQSFTECDDVESCVGKDDWRGHDVSCDGRWSCSDSSFPGTQSWRGIDKIGCSGFESCLRFTVDVAERVELHGGNSGQRANIKSVERVEAYGEGSAQAAVIDSGTKTSMKLWFYGELAGKGAIIKCQSGATCDLKCAGTGCKDLEMQCADGATCLVTPNNCLTTTKPTVKGVFCPTISDVITDAEGVGGRQIGLETERSSSPERECNSEWACSRQAITATGDIDCGAGHGCPWATLVTDGTVICDGSAGCAANSITAGAVLAGAGVGYTVKADSIKSMGYLSMRDATIDSEGRATVDVDIGGYYGGIRTKFHCRSGSECSLICHGNACTDLEYMCYDGATCNVTPKQCNLKKSGKTIKGVVCPNISEVASTDAVSVGIQYLLGIVLAFNLSVLGYTVCCSGEGKRFKVVA